MSIRDLSQLEEPDWLIVHLLERIHENGPVAPRDLEQLAYVKIWFPQVFREYEEKILAVLGLFYKIQSPSSIYSILLSSLGVGYKETYGHPLTPVQGSIRNAIESMDVISISAPTSSGKSFSIRDYIKKCECDVVITVPSRALIAEYIGEMRESYGLDKTVMISPFVDDVFSERSPRRIFVLTPERASELFRPDIDLSPGVFFFDEAQSTDDMSRAVAFDSLIRRVQKKYPFAKLIFAHPGVRNPEAQLGKHGITSSRSFSRVYDHGAVGRVCVFRHGNGRFYYFSPYEEKGYLLINCAEHGGSFPDFVFRERKSVLVYVSKNSIYNGTFLEPFKQYIADFDEIESRKALGIIDQIANMIGADEGEHRSYMVDLMRKGVVIHHGSVPLDVRYLVEQFIKSGFSRICFATSTLAQGVNMPFDVLWLESMRFLGDDDRWASLSFKNLVGRAGRLSKGAEFDFGYIYTKSPKLFCERMASEFELDDTSVFDRKSFDGMEDQREAIEAIKEGEFDEELNAPRAKVSRLSQPNILWAVRRLLDLMYGVDGADVPPDLSGAEQKFKREAIREEFKEVWKAGIGRELEDGEKAVFDQAIFILLQMAQGRSFREIAGLRYAYVSKRDAQKEGRVRFVQKAENLPNKNLKRPFPIFSHDTLAKEVNYDALVFDTYDYMDQVISFSLADTFVVALSAYAQEEGDDRAELLVELLRYGTNNKVHIMLMRYGFPPESVKEIERYVISIDHSSVRFSKDIESAPQNIKELAAWYLPD
ncbi:DEAD/DEAH box helicase [Gammaproteobacteria bacterium AB-CW1]|uniref:DEAD/DEAH box helicase n=1 Tax=Natronospira elongata TaxID=3110268 RepID=A0AAP6JI64_9GAMM|nr:DEAD/DEAH box helicase [Gammaproteobacteria bacterium AB-CW1]